MSVAKTGLVKWLEYILARGAVSLIQCLPIPVAYRLGRGVGSLLHFVMKGRRAIVRRNLGIVDEWLASRGDSLEGTIDEQVLEVFKRTGANTLCSFSFGTLSPEKMGRYVRISGFDEGQAIYDQSPGGLVVILAHMGPWELLPFLSHMLKERGAEVSLGALYRPFNNRYFDQWFRGLRERKGTRLFNRDTGFHAPVEFLKQGGVLGVLSDQRMREGARASFFGKETMSSPLAGLFVKRANVAAIGLAICTVGPCKWELVVVPADMTLVAGDRSRQALAKLSNTTLEQSLSKSPLDGFWFHNRFKGVE